ncbi:hypothetical protein LCGC14_1764780 [marine sediment metagenome]|uniref:Uncharacterized protein n=1 Tax=marine sediment metagenome TaxID=412755 RepID=A0A0F9HMG8_9ZZZZ
MTELSNKMDSIGKNGYRADMARRILKGQEDGMVKQAIILDIIGVLQDLDGDTLTELYEHVKILRKRQQILPEQPTDGQAEASEGKPETPADSTGIGGDCGNCGAEDTRLYSCISGGQKVDICAECARMARLQEAQELP